MRTAQDTAEGWDSRVGRTRSAVLEASRQVLAEFGYAGFTIEEVVSRSGVAKTTIYRHWPTRADLLMATVDRLAHEPVEPDTGDIRADLTSVLCGLVDALRLDPWLRSLPSLVHAADRDAKLAAVYDRVMQARLSRRQAILARGIERGELRDDLDLDLAWQSLAGTIVFRQLVIGCDTTGDDVERLVDAAMTGLAPPPMAGDLHVGGGTGDV